MIQRISKPNNFENMKQLSSKTGFMLYRLMKIAKENPECRAVIKNNDSFMPVHIERIDRNSIGEQWSVCHYGKQNGDLMRDPEVIFLVYPNDMYFPIYYRNDYLGIEYDTVVFKDGQPSGFYRQKYNDLRSFCDMWMKNIKWQQF